MKIRLRISPVHLYLVTPSDKSFLLWKRNLWCINWFSLWKWLFILYDSCDSRGAPAPFHFMVSSGRRESETIGSLWIARSIFNRETRVHPSQLYMSISGFMIVGLLWIWLQFTRTSGQPGIHRASAHYRRHLTVPPQASHSLPNPRHALSYLQKHPKP